MSTNVLSKKIVCPKTGFVKICCVENVSPKKFFFKKFLFQKIFCSKKYWSRNFGPKNYGLENLVQKNWSKDIFWFRKNYGPKNCSKKCLPEKLLVRKLLDPKKFWV